MTKYKEIVIESIDQVKVGDLVRVFYSGDSFDGNVGGVEKEQIYFVGRLTKYHFKQCRILEEVKPREWWIHEELSGRNDGQVVLKAPPSQPENYIKVQEVLE